MPGNMTDSLMYQQDLFKQLSNQIFFFVQSYKFETSNQVHKR